MPGMPQDQKDLIHQAFTDLKTWVRCTEQVARLALKGRRSPLKATGLRV